MLPINLINMYTFLLNNCLPNIKSYYVDEVYHITENFITYFPSWNRWSTNLNSIIFYIHDETIIDNLKRWYYDQRN